MKSLAVQAIRRTPQRHLGVLLVVGANVRYVRLTFTANTGWPAGQLSELQAYPS